MKVGKFVILSLVFAVFGKQRKSVTAQTVNDGMFSVTYNGTVTNNKTVSYKFDYRVTTANVSMLTVFLQKVNCTIVISLH